MKAKSLQIAAWSLGTLVVVLAVLAWGQGYEWRFSLLTPYQYFPLFGLLAFSLMWSHYIMSALRRYSGHERYVLASYAKSTSMAVLVLLLAHPGLLAWQLWRSGLGLPPGSYKLYVGSLYVWVVVGLIAWIAFMAYELRRKYVTRSWWKYIGYASDVAMFLIFFHALKLGTHLQAGWFEYVWYFYGLALATCLTYIHVFAPKRPSR